MSVFHVELYIRSVLAFSSKELWSTAITLEVTTHTWMQETFPESSHIVWILMIMIFHRLNCLSLSLGSEGSVNYSTAGRLRTEDSFSWGEQGFLSGMYNIAAFFPVTPPRIQRNSDFSIRHCPTLYIWWKPPQIQAAVTRLMARNGCVCGQSRFEPI